MWNLEYEVDMRNMEIETLRKKLEVGEKNSKKQLSKVKAKLEEKDAFHKEALELELERLAEDLATLKKERLILSLATVLAITALTLVLKVIHILFHFTHNTSFPKCFLRINIIPIRYYFKTNTASRGWRITRLNAPLLLFKEMKR